MKRILTFTAAVVLAALTWSAVYYCQHDRSDILYVKIAAVYEGELNASHAAVMLKEAIETSADSFKNVPILLSHQHDNLDACIGRTISAKLAFDNITHKYYLEVVAVIHGKNVIDKIKGDLYHSISVGFNLDEGVCSIDNMDIEDCPHKIGQSYKVNGKQTIARVVIKRMTGLEISFVNVPASTGARILNSANDVTSLDTSK